MKQTMVIFFPSLKVKSISNKIFKFLYHLESEQLHLFFTYLPFQIHFSIRVRFRSSVVKMICVKKWTPVIILIDLVQLDTGQ